jgi:hypothetical protein
MMILNQTQLWEEPKLLNTTMGWNIDLIESWWWFLNYDYQAVDTELNQSLLQPKSVLHWNPATCINYILDGVSVLTKKYVKQICPSCKLDVQFLIPHGWQIFHLVRNQNKSSWLLILTSLHHKNIFWQEFRMPQMLRSVQLLWILWSLVLRTDLLFILLQ